MRLPKTTLETPRLRIEPADPSHAESMWKAVEVSLSELSPWLPWTERVSLDEEKLWLARAANEWDEGVQWAFLIFDRSTGDPLGGVGLSNFLPMTSQASLGYWIRSDRAGQGFMTEAVREVVRFGFEDLKLHRIELRAAPENQASIRVAEKVGFVREGLLRESGRGADPARRHDHYVFGLLASDWRAR